MKGARREFLLLTALLLGWNLAWAWVVLVRWGLIPADAAARTLLAAQVFFGRDPKLANLGFVWLPLPALLQLPLVVVPGLWPTGLAGAAVSALGGALAGGLINDTARFLGWGRARHLLVAAFALNPAVIYLSASGLTEPLLMAAALGQVRCFLGWAEAERRADRRQAVGWLVGLGLSSGAAVLTRYEGWVLSGAVALMVGLTALKRGGPQVAEAAVLVYGAPPAYAAFLWVFFNWLIMGDPLYFLRGPYAAAAAARATTQWQSLESAATETVRAAWSVSPVFFGALGGSILTGLAVRNPTGVLLGGFWLAVPVFLAVSSGLGQLGVVQYRYVCLLIPGTICLTAAAVRTGAPGWQLAAGLTVALLGPPASLAGMLQDPASVNNSLRPFAEALLSGRVGERWAHERELADYLAGTGAGPILTDTYGGVEMVIFFSGDPGRFIVPGDRDFEAVLQDPVGKAGHVLVPAPVGAGRLHRLNQVYPGLYASGASWAGLEREVGPYRLYRVAGPPPTEGAPRAPAVRGSPTPGWVRPAALGLIAIGVLGVAAALFRPRSAVGP